MDIINTVMRMAILALLLLASPAAALNEGLQCVPYARALSGVEIRGDAHTWWGQAEGRYVRGNTPRAGAVLAFRPHGAMRLGHVAAVRRILDKRTILVSHANWSTINGIRGHIENDVRVVDVSEANDWSRVRVWYTPNAALGTTEWPAHGFIYPAKARPEKDMRMAVASLVKPGAVVQALTPATANLPAPAKAKAAAPAFRLSGRLLAELDRTAKKEAKRKAS